VSKQSGLVSDPDKRLRWKERAVLARLEKWRRVLKRQSNIREQVLNGTKIMCRDVQINLCARDLSVAKQIADRYDSNTRPNEMSGECVPEFMR
jgi:hypothetical protein